jgi:hypothetical protein
LGGELALEGLLEPLDLGAGGGVVGTGGILGDAEGLELGFQSVAAALPPVRRVVNAISVSVRVASGTPCWATVAQKVA